MRLKSQCSHARFLSLDEGIEYLREYLHIPEGVVPETLTKAAAKPARAPNSGYNREGRDGDYEGRRGGDFKRGGERGGYRRGGEGGFGRGRRENRD